MAENKQKPNIVLQPFEDMLNFNTKEPAPGIGGLTELAFDRMEPFPNHRFKLYEGQKLADMVESIRQLGILLPIILWHTDDGKYVVLSGHNRIEAGRLAGLTKGPVIIKENLTHADAVMIVVETNLYQRSFAEMSHSERAYCLSEHYEAMKSQGRRNDILNEIKELLNVHNNKENSTSSELQTKLRSDEKLGQDYGLSRDKVAKYIRISNLAPSLLSQVDDGEIAFLSAYELSFVEDSEKQQQIIDYMESDGYKLNMKKAELLREYYENKKLTESAIIQILSGEKTRGPQTDKPKPVRIKPAVVSKYFTSGQSQKEIESIIEKALALYFETSP